MRGAPIDTKDDGGNFSMQSATGISGISNQTKRKRLEPRDLILKRDTRYNVTVSELRVDNSLTYRLCRVVPVRGSRGIISYNWTLS